MRFSGPVGFEIYSEVTPGVWDTTVVEKPYKGDVEQEVRRLYPTDDRNDDINIDNRIRITANPYALHNYQQIKFVEYMGSCWIVKTVDIRNYPSMYLYLGGVYHGKRQAKTKQED